MSKWSSHRFVTYIRGLDSLVAGKNLSSERKLGSGEKSVNTVVGLLLVESLKGGLDDVALLSNQVVELKTHLAVASQVDKGLGEGDEDGAEKRRLEDELRSLDNGGDGSHCGSM